MISELLLANNTRNIKKLPSKLAEFFPVQWLPSPIVRFRFVPEGRLVQINSIDCLLYGKLLQLCTHRIDLTNELWFSLPGYSFGSPHVIEHLDSDEHQYLTDVYKIFLPEISTEDIPSVCYKYASIEFCRERYGSTFSRLDRFSYILGRELRR